MNRAVIAVQGAAVGRPVSPSLPLSVAEIDIPTNDLALLPWLIFFTKGRANGAHLHLADDVHSLRFESGLCIKGLVGVMASFWRSVQQDYDTLSRKKARKALKQSGEMPAERAASLPAAKELCSSPSCFSSAAAPWDHAAGGLRGAEHTCAHDDMQISLAAAGGPLSLVPSWVWQFLRSINPVEEARLEKLREMRRTPCSSLEHLSTALRS